MEKKYTYEDIIGFSVITFFLTTMVALLICLSCYPDITLSQEAADDICKQLTGNYTAIGTDDYNGKRLICTLPSFDSTHNIIVRNNK